MQYDSINSVSSGRVRRPPTSDLTHQPVPKQSTMLRKATRKLARFGELHRIMKQRAREGNLSPSRQMLEILYLWSKNRLTPGYYYAAGLYRKELSLRQKRDFLSAKRYEARLRRINDPRFGFITLNKIVTFGLLRMFSVPTPPFLGVVGQGAGQTFDGRPFQTAADFEGLVDRTGIYDVCFKYVGGWCGYGFQKVRIERHNDQMFAVLHPDETRMTLGEFWDATLSRAKAVSGDPKSHFGILCQGLVDQHPTIAALHPQSLNTARLWLYQAEPGRWDVFAGILRMGVGDMCVDNSAQGGILSRIDLSTGRLDAATDTTALRPMFMSHPTTGEQIEGIELPMWEQVLPLCYRACAAFPHLRLLGIDIAFSRTQPLVLELEAEPHSNHQIGFGRGVAEVLDRLDETQDLVATN